MLMHFITLCPWRLRLSFLPNPCQSDIWWLGGIPTNLYLSVSTVTVPSWRRGFLSWHVYWNWALFTVNCIHIHCCITWVTCLQLIDKTCLAPLCGLESEAILFASAWKRLQQRRRAAEKRSFTMYNKYSGFESHTNDTGLYQTTIHCITCYLRIIVVHVYVNVEVCTISILCWI